jgi:hypothetical protein
MPEFGELKPVDIRELWPNEARDFTPWLAENIERLGEAVGMDLEIVAQEAEVGDLSLDLLVKDPTEVRRMRDRPRQRPQCRNRESVWCDES